MIVIDRFAHVKVPRFIEIAACASPTDFIDVIIFVSPLQERSSLNFRQHGAELWPGAVTAVLPILRKTLAALPSDRPGVRIHGLEPLRALLAKDGHIGAIAAA